MDWETHARRILARLGEDATYTPPGGGSTSTVRGIFQRPYVESQGMEASAPTFACMSSDVPTLAEGALFAVRGVTYKVRRPEPDPLSGLVQAQLHRTV